MGIEFVLGDCCVGVSVPCGTWTIWDLGKGMLYKVAFSMLYFVFVERGLVAVFVCRCCICIVHHVCFVQQVRHNFILLHNAGLRVETVKLNHHEARIVITYRSLWRYFVNKGYFILNSINSPVFVENHP